MGTVMIGNAKEYPWMVPPPGFRPIYRPGGPRVITGAVGVLTPLENIQPMQGMKGWIRRMGLESGDWDLVGFQIRAGQTPLAELALIRTPIGSPSTPEDVYIEVNPNMPVTIFAVNLQPVPGNVPVRWYLGGWYYQEVKR
jgi:hypothetical protein